MNFRHLLTSISLLVPWVIFAKADVVPMEDDVPPPPDASLSFSTQTIIAGIALTLAIVAAGIIWSRRNQLVN
ncbi:MAG: hypothetical protein COA78_29835 [Blastopirellula sp.]|nr:MAG: hypothetical protein COA78_29835 [Blastopirellula sp.]